jgi:hypothetical protein
MRSSTHDVVATYGRPEGSPQLGQLAGKTGSLAMEIAGVMNVKVYPTGANKNRDNHPLRNDVF